MLSSLWAYRGYVVGWIARDFQSRYLGSVLGPVWTLLGPAAQIAIYMIVFSQIMRGRLPGIDDTLAFGIFLCIGIIGWQSFLESLTKFQTVFFDNAALIKKLNFPRTIIPVTVLISSCINFLLMLIVFTIFLVIADRFPGWSYLLIFPVALFLQMFAIGFGLFLGVLNIFFRDVSQFVAVLVTFWFWATPIVYPVTILPETIQNVVSLNPVYVAFRTLQQIVLGAPLPPLSSWVGPVVLTVVFLIVSYVMFRKLTPQILDEL